MTGPAREPEEEAAVSVETVERLLEAIYVAAPGASLRREDRRKAVEVAAMLREIERAARRLSARDPLCLVDAAAGKAYVGLLAAKLVLEPLGRPAAVVTLERDARRATAARLAAERLASRVGIDCRVVEVADSSAWPEEASIVAALHACGPAADAVLDRAVGSRARSLLLVPCCTGEGVAGLRAAADQARALGIPRQAPVRRRFLQSCVDALRTLRLEAAGYQTEVVELVPPTVTPHNLLWRARRVGEPGRMADARRRLDAWNAG